MALNIVRNRLADFVVFKDGVERLGIADITLPDVEYMADSIKGPGISGEVNMPTMGMTGPMNIIINWRTINADLTELGAPKAHDLECRGAIQQYDSATGTISMLPAVLKVRGIPTKIGLGKFENSATTDSSNELECVYLKLTIDSSTKIEIDKFARVFSIEGTDYYADIRTALGL